MNLIGRLISLIVLIVATGSAMGKEPRLIVLLVVDQLTPDRITAEMPGGLGRLMREGYVFSHAMLDHGLTNTCPGHVVISTGVNPARAGIPGNSYIDHQTMAQRYCVDDSDDANRVPVTGENRSPNALRVTALGDWLKNSESRSKVVSISAKDRAAIALGGKHPDTVLWYNMKTGNFSTSGYYGELPGYVNVFNDKGLLYSGAGANIDGVWSHGPGSVRPDDYAGEDTRYLRHSGHPVNVGESGTRFDQIYRSPYMDLLTWELVRRAIDAEKLGARGVTDLLAVSLSATDTVGHLYGPFSAEAEDNLQSLDRIVGDLLALLDKELDGDYVLAFSADHGVLPLPEWLIEKGESRCPVPETRISYESLGLGVYWKLYWSHTRPFGNPANLIGFSAAGIVVNRHYARELGIAVEDVVSTLETYLEERQGVKAAWTEDEIFSSDDPEARLYRNSFVKGKSGDLIVQFHETCLVYGDQGTTHGSPYEYDRHVPLVFFGQGVKNHTDPAAVHTIDIAPTIADHLRLPMPDNLDGRPLPVWKTSQ